jgi:hypothetical protein
VKNGYGQNELKEESLAHEGPVNGAAVGTKGIQNGDEQQKAGEDAEVVIQENKR